MTAGQLPDFSSARVLVAGDVMLDRYWQGATSRISPEAPVPVVHIGECEERPGGAANVAVNIAVLGARVGLAGQVGDDEAGHRLLDLLQARGIDCRLEMQPDVTTITKMRVLSRHQQLIRLDFENTIAATHSEKFLQRVAGQLAAFDVLVLSDYDKGTLYDVPAIIARAREAGVPVLVDPKGNDFSRYRGADLLTPNLAEFESIVGHCRDDEELALKGQALCRDLMLKALLVTRSEKGMTLLRPDHEAVHFPAQAQDVFDVTGAGDTVMSVLATAMAAGAALENAVKWANLAAGIAVTRLGAVAVSRMELEQKLQTMPIPALKTQRSVLDEATLLDVVHSARAAGERIVMTNGCFDLLHAGHVSYLEKARQLGDRLLVAVNDDSSVNGLKMKGRPIIPLAQRMRVLAALASVDWVVPFSESTPQRLIEKVMPDVLVKGGDYRPDGIAGAEAVRQHGGDVVVLEYEAGLSTSAIIEKIMTTTG